MNTPICDFVRSYCESGSLRMHMPGHKGLPLLGMEALDITEFAGADSLYEADGIIKESEDNATALFGTESTLFTTEGSSHAIRAMLYLISFYAREQGRSPRILAARNAHRTFVMAAGVLNMDIEWLTPSESATLLSFPIEDLCQLREDIRRTEPVALYITSPDYLGNTADIRSIAKICREEGILLAVDNAHGAYRRFLSESLHPIDLGAHMCCDSAHKTLPALTGAAYLHFSKECPESIVKMGKDALALFGSTSPSYLIMQSLDAVNAYLADGYKEKLAAFIEYADSEKLNLMKDGFKFVGDEPIKWSIRPASIGYTGTELADVLAQNKIFVEFADHDFVVFMLSCEAGKSDLDILSEALRTVRKKVPLKVSDSMKLHIPVRKMTIHDALFSRKKRIPVGEAEGKVLASVNVSCPPAVPIAVCGEVIDSMVIERFFYYGIESCDVID